MPGYPAFCPNPPSRGERFPAYNESLAFQTIPGFPASLPVPPPGFRGGSRNSGPTATMSNMNNENVTYAQDTTTTPGQPAYYNPIRKDEKSQTEPRDFAPRRRGINDMPPPAFNLSGAATATQGPFGTPAMHSQADHLAQPMALATIPQDQVVPLPAITTGPVDPAIRVLRSDKLNKLTAGLTGRPLVGIALADDNFPFTEIHSQAAPVEYGVIKIKNIPYTSKRAEVIALLGRSSKILNDADEPVHIIMERVTTKTRDAYVEFMTPQDALKAVERINELVSKGRQPRLGDRPVEIELSNQGALMKDLFPFATGIIWSGSMPIVQPPVPGQPWKTFKGFVTEEEMTMLVKFVESPARVSVHPVPDPRPTILTAFLLVALRT